MAASKPNDAAEFIHEFFKDSRGSRDPTNGQQTGSVLSNSDIINQTYYGAEQYSEDKKNST